MCQTIVQYVMWGTEYQKKCYKLRKCRYSVIELIHVGLSYTMNGGHTESHNVGEAMHMIYTQPKMLTIQLV